jgi:hypothetical protein
MRGIAQFGHIVIDVEIDRLRRFASKMIMSQPAIFNSAPQCPPEFEQAIAPVSGLLVMTV